MWEKSLLSGFLEGVGRVTVNTLIFFRLIILLFYTGLIIASFIRITLSWYYVCVWFATERNTHTKVYQDNIIPKACNCTITWGPFFTGQGFGQICKNKSEHESQNNMLTECKFEMFTYQKLCHFGIKHYMEVLNKTNVSKTRHLACFHVGHVCKTFSNIKYRLQKR